MQIVACATRRGATSYEPLTLRRIFTKYTKLWAHPTHYFTSYDSYELLLFNTFKFNSVKKEGLIQRTEYVNEIMYRYVIMKQLGYLLKLLEFFHEVHRVARADD